MEFVKEMAFYSAYHQERRNVWIHVFGVPTITFSLLIVMSWIQLLSIGNADITLAMLFAFLVLLYYMFLDLSLGLVASLVFGGLLFAAHTISHSVDANTAWILFGACQILGWGSQFYGHYVFEKSKPALFDNLFQAIVSAPLFVVADVCFSLGFRKDLEEGVKSILKERGLYKEFVQ